MVHKAFIIRERTPIEIMLYAIYLYLLGLSLRNVSKALLMLKVRRSHEAIRKWIHRFASYAYEWLRSMHARKVVVDETAINIGGRRYWLWSALEPENRAVVSIHISMDRSGFTAYSFLLNLRRRHGVRLIITDGGPWYVLAARWARLSHTVIVGGDRSYVERFIESLKDRLRGFDTYFPEFKYPPSSAYRLISAWIGYYNFARIHMTLGRPPKPLPGSTELEKLSKIIFKR